MMNCKCCGVKMAKNWSNGYCFHCDWYLGIGWTEEKIKQFISKDEKPEHSDGWYFTTEPAFSSEVRCESWMKNP